MQQMSLALKEKMHCIAGPSLLLIVLAFIHGSRKVKTQEVNRLGGISIYLSGCCPSCSQTILRLSSPS